MMLRQMDLYQREHGGYMPQHLKTPDYDLVDALYAKGYAMPHYGDDVDKGRILLEIEVTDDGLAYIEHRKHVRRVELRANVALAVSVIAIAISLIANRQSIAEWLGTATNQTSIARQQEQ